MCISYHQQADNEASGGGKEHTLNGTGERDVRWVSAEAGQLSSEVVSSELWPEGWVSLMRIKAKKAKQI